VSGRRRLRARPRRITAEELAAWQEIEYLRCITGLAPSEDSLRVLSIGDLVERGSVTDELSEACRSEIVVAERCCNALDFSAPAVLRSDPWRETVVGGSGDDIDGLDTSAVAPTFGLVMAGLAAMLIAAFSPFLLAKLLSSDPGASTGEARGAVGGSISSAKGSVTSTAGKVGSMAKKAGG
jgi:hypothetical protein